MNTKFKEILDKNKGEMPLTMNIAIMEAAKELGIDLDLGNNWKWSASATDTETQALAVNGNFLKALNKLGVETNCKPEEADKLYDEAQNVEGNCLKLILKFDNVIAEAPLFLGHLDIRGLTTLDLWCDTNQIEIVK